MKLKDTILLVLFGVLIGHIDDLATMLIQFVGNIQAEHATEVQYRINNMAMISEPEEIEKVIEGFIHDDN